MAYQNFFATKLFTDIGAADTTITLETAPSVTNGRLTLEARNATQREIIKYSGVSGNQITGVLRAQGGTTAKAHIKNSLVEMNATGEDLQDVLTAFNTFTPSGNNWIGSPYTFSSVTYLGNGSYQCTIAGQDLTNIWSPGMRLRTTRTIPAPTQSTSLNGTTQYWSKVAPAGMTFTNNFVASAWVKVSSYPSVDTGIISRYNGTSGWILSLRASGQVALQGYNGAGANFSAVTSFQSLPLNKWVHVTAQLDMLSFTATPTTSYTMLNGVDVPASVSRGGTNPTAIVQAGDLNIGAYNAGAVGSFFPGKVAQPAVFSAPVTQANIRTYYSQGLAGTETSLVSAYAFNGTAVDLNTTNANNLTANAAAGYTTDAPWTVQASGTPNGTLDYGIVQSVSFATNTTVVVQVPEGCTIPTSGGVSAVAYSSVKVPFGFPSEKSKWIVGIEVLTAVNTSGTVSNTVYNPGGLKLSVPIGKWTLRGRVNSQAQSTGTLSDIITGLSTSASALANPRWITRDYVLQGAATFRIWMSLINDFVDVSTATDVFLVIKVQNGFTQSDIRGDSLYGSTVVEVENAYL